MNDGERPLALSLASLGGERSIAERVESAYALGFGIFETTALDDADARSAGRALALGRGRVAVVSMPEAPIRPLNSPAPPRRELGRALEQAVAAAAILRSGRVVVRLGEIESADPALRMRAERALSGDKGAVDAAFLTALQGLDRGRVGALEIWAKRLHGLVRAHPGLKFDVLLEASPLGLLTADLFDAWNGEITSLGVGLFYDTAAAHLRALLGVEPAGVWTGRFARTIRGAYVSDCLEFTTGLLPGSGSVDFAGLRFALGREAIRVLKVHGPLHRLALDRARECLG